MICRVVLCLVGLFLVGAPLAAREDRPIKVLFLGDNGHHRPAERFRDLQPVLAARGIDLVYTDKVEVLQSRTLAAYDGLVVYANIAAITPEQEQALLDYIEGGKGFIPLHCASYCFLNSARYVALVGAQFRRHETGTFRTTIAEPGHPIMKGFRGFESWDETYVHHRHNERDRTVLEYRTEKGEREPWTWVRTQGKGRVFYTAWGHDERTWTNPGFRNLVERGIRWAVGADPSTVPDFVDRPALTPKRTDVKPFEYFEARVPFYPAGQPWGKTAEPVRKLQKPFDPGESRKHFVTPVDFEVKLFASEPMLGGKPICMNWDEQGRLWVAVSVDYPNELQPEGKGRDRILVLEDTDGDGVADKARVFADKLSIPTSLIFARGGVIVHQAPHTLFLRDTDGDGVADERRVLFTGWHTGDTHAGPSNLHYGLDNWLYGIVGYSGFDGTIGGERQSFRTGFYRFRIGDFGLRIKQERSAIPNPPSAIRFEFLRNTNNNSWGVGLSEEGVLFGSTANGNPSVHMPIPNRYYETVRGWSSSVLGTIAENARMEPITDKVRQVDHHGNFTAAAGHALYTARTYPREYWNRTAFVTEPTGHLVATFRIQAAGASFRSRNSWNLLASDDEWASPIMAEVGPDGHVWVIDWYNCIVQHNPTPPGFKTGKGNAYETELRDKKHGRIYRVVYRPAAPAPAFTLKDAPVEKLVAGLKHDNLFWRRHAQRLLIERSQKDVVPDLLKLAADPGMDEIDLNVGVIHALWTLHGLGALDGSDPKATAGAAAALKHRSAGVRRNAVQVLPHKPESLQAIREARLLHDGDAQVRLAALLAVADLSLPGAAGELLEVLGDDRVLGDRWLSDALTIAAAAHAGEFLPLLARKWPQALSAGQVGLVERVAEHHARGGPADTIGALLQAMAEGQPAVADTLIAGLARGWPRDRAPALAEEAEKRLVQLLPKLSPSGRGQLVTLASRWGSKVLDRHAAEIGAAFRAQLRDEKATDTARIQAAAQLIEFRRTDDDSARQLLALLTPRTSPELAQGLLEAISRSEAPAAGPSLVEVLPQVTPQVRATALRVLLGRAEWTELLLDRIDRGQVQLGELSLDQKQGLANHPRKAIATRARALLARGGGLPSPDRQKVIDELAPLGARAGDAAAGKAVFKNHCAKCHTHSGEGARIGPDLTGMAVHPKAHLLTEIIDPSRSVEGNYRQYTVATRNGRILTGLLASESKTAIELIDGEAKKQAVQRDEIEEIQASTKSFMPDGFEKQLKPEELVNLLEFLVQRGKYLPLPLDKAATVVSTRGMFFGEESLVERLIFPDWTPKSFQGVPFYLIDPQGDRVPNVVLLHGPQGRTPPRMPRSVSLACNAPARAVHLLSGVSGWGYPIGEKGSVSVIVRLHYEDGKTEEHPLRNGEHFADYIRRVDVPGSQFAFALRSQQVRYLAIHPQRTDKISRIEFVKGTDRTAPIIMAVTIESHQ